MRPAAIACAATALLRLLLQLYPARFRLTFGDDVVSHAAREIASAPDSASAWGRAGRELASALRGLPGEHRAEWTAKRAGRNPQASGSLLADLRLARRHIAAVPAGSAIVVLTFALAIGAATAIFSVADAVLFRPLPYPDSHRLVRLEEITREPSRDGVSLPAIAIWSREVKSLESLASFEPVTTLVIIGDEPDRLSGARSVSAGFFDVLGVQPAVGRPFTPFDDFTSEREVIISHALWQRLGGTQESIGSSIVIDPGRHTIVGVMPPGFSYPAGAHFWVAARDPGDMLRTARTLRFRQAVGRLAQTSDLAALRAELDLLTERYPATYPSTGPIRGPIRMSATGLQDTIVGHVRGGILTAGAAVALLLLVACCNITGLMLAESTARHRERAVQLALGASPGRIARQQLLQLACLAAPGAALGILLAAVCRDALVALSLDEVPRIAGATIDGRVLVFSFLVTAAAALTATLVPSWRSARVRATAALHAASRSGGHARSVIRILRGLVIAQVAATFVLAVGGALLARTLDRLTRIDPGFEPSGVLSMRLNMPLSAVGKANREWQRAFYAEVLERVRALPGVVTAGYSSRLPLSNDQLSSEVAPADDPVRLHDAGMTMASDGYFRTIRTAVVAGREIAPSDRLDAPVVVVNDVLARQLFPGGEATGRRVRFSLLGGTHEATIVGVTEAVHYNGLTGGPGPELTIDYRLRPLVMRLFVKTGGPAAVVVPLVRSAVRQADTTRRVTVDEVTSLDQEVARHLARPRFYLALLGAFGLSALLLAATGLYGVMTFAVEARRHDMGVRLALGASPGRIFREALGTGAGLVAAGLSAGLVTAYAATGMLESLLYGVAPRDPVTFAVTATFVSAVVLLACWRPARTAGRIDPLAVMRVE